MVMFPSRVLVWAIVLTLLVSSSILAQENGAAANGNGEQPSGSSTEINVKNAELGAIIKIFSKKTKRNYILDESVKGKVTIFLPGRVSDDESIRILEAILALKGFTSVPIGENIWKIVPAKDAKQSTIPTYSGERNLNPTAAVVTRLVRLKFVGAEDIQKLLAQLVSANGLVSAYSRTNSLVIIDSEDNIERLLDIVEAVDIASSDRDMTIIPIKNADAAEIADTLKDILGEQEQSAGDGVAEARSRTLDLIRSRIAEGGSGERLPPGVVPGGGLGANVNITARGQAAKIIADVRTNSIILVADETDTARIRALISQLDSEIDLSGHRFYVYRCQHANAEELADVLGGLTGSGGGSTRSSASAEGLQNQATGLSRVGDDARASRGSSSLRTEQRLANSRRTPGRSRNETQQRQGAASVSFSEELSITADPSTNSLIIASSKSDYEKIKELLKQLDVKRRQVLVEAILLEVAITDTTSLGTEFLTSTGGVDGGVLVSNSLGNLSTLFTNPTQLSNFAAAAASSGTLTLPGDITIPTQSMLVTALESNSNVNVLSAPTILATDNEPAEIVVGQNVPFIASTSTSTDNLNNTFNQIDRQDVGITLRLTPQISSGEYVTMNIFTEVSNVVAATAASAVGPTTTLRTSETTVITKNGQMVVIGGLMSDDVSQSENGIPFLKDIPVVGYLFKLSAEDRRRTNLLIFITPRVIKDQYDHRDLTLVKRDKLEDVLITRDFGPSRSEILRSREIDDVAEYSAYDGVKPSTIIPPAPARKRLAPANEQAQSPGVADSSASDVIELRVSPDLPSPALPQHEAPTSLDPEMRGRFEQLPVIENTFLFVVLQSVEKLSNELAAQVPFQVANGSGAVGLVLDASQRYFEVGDNIAYQLGSNAPQFKVVGVFHSAPAALRLFPELSAGWYTL